MGDENNFEVLADVMINFPEEAQTFFSKLKEKGIRGPAIDRLFNESGKNLKEFIEAVLTLPIHAFAPPPPPRARRGHVEEKVSHVKRERAEQEKRERAEQEKRER